LAAAAGSSPAWLDLQSIVEHVGHLVTVAQLVMAVAVQDGALHRQAAWRFCAAQLSTIQDLVLK